MNQAFIIVYPKILDIAVYPKILDIAVYKARSSVTASMAFKIVGKVLLKINSPPPPLMTFRAGSGRKKPVQSQQTVQRLLKSQYPALSLIGKQNTLFYLEKQNVF